MRCIVQAIIKLAICQQPANENQEPTKEILGKD
jgi:hypothetical protein